MLTGAGGQDPGKAVLYARVSTAGQVRRGYSLAQQLEALRAHAQRAGYRVVEEVLDPGQSAATLNRPGLERVRDVVAAGGVSVVLVQDLDRLTREPEHYRLLRGEFRESCCEVVVLNNHGTPDAHLARREVEVLAERSMRGKLRKAREGKIVAGTSATYGFRFNATRDGYEVDRETMEVVGRIFRMLSVEKRTLHAVKRTLEAQNVPTPSGGRRWSTCVIRRFVFDDVYRPHAVREIEALVSGDVAARLDPESRYGIWWFNRERWTTRRVPDASAGSGYRTSVRSVPRPREEWIAVPVPDSGLSSEVVDAAREALRDNRWNTGGAHRFWELSGGILRCGACGSRMRTCVTRKKPDRVYLYYTCAKHHKERDACPNRRSYRAGILEGVVWGAACELLADAGRVREGFEDEVRRERSRPTGEAGEKEPALLERLAEIDHARDRYQAMTAGGLMTFDELESKLAELGATRRIAQGELRAVRDRNVEAERLEREREALLEVCAGAQAGTPAGALSALRPEDRRRIYSMMRLAVVVGQNGDLRVSGIPGTAVIGIDGP